MLQIRLAHKGDEGRVRDFYYSLIDAMEDAPFRPGWEKDVYPSRQFLNESIEAGEMYIGEEDGQTASCMVVNHKYNDGYHKNCWSVEVSDEQLAVIHALGVHPRFAGKGIAGQMVCHAMERARESGMRTIRLDVLKGNLPAEKVYAKLGFQYVDTIRMYYEDTGWTDFGVFELLL